jgi:hypothetical protein
LGPVDRGYQRRQVEAIKAGLAEKKGIRPSTRTRTRNGGQNSVKNAFAAVQWRNIKGVPVHHNCAGVFVYRSVFGHPTCFWLLSGNATGVRVYDCHSDYFFRLDTLEYFSVLDLYSESHIVDSEGLKSFRLAGKLLNLRRSAEALERGRLLMINDAQKPPPN